MFSIYTINWGGYENYKFMKINFQFISKYKSMGKKFKNKIFN